MPDLVRQEKGDTIYRQDAIDVVSESMRQNLHQDGKEACCHEYEHRHFLHILYKLPSAQKKGHWNFVGDNLFKCTCCGEMYTTQQLNGLRVYDKDPYCPFFCPNCGADMRGENDV